MRIPSLILALLSVHALAADSVFVYDQEAQTVRASKLDNPLFYDASIATEGGRTFLAWLEFEPGRGDVIWFCVRDEHGKWLERERITAEPGDYASPTLTLDAEKRLWLSYEAGRKDDWNVMLTTRRADGGFAPVVRVNAAGTGPHLHHRVAASPTRGVWIVWQGDGGGQFDVFARRLLAPPDAAAADEAATRIVKVSASPRGDWHPAIAITPDDTAWVAWDSHDGTSYNILARECRGGSWGDILAVTSSPNFNAHAQLAADRTGRVWLAWEEDGPNWGRMYRPRDDAAKEPTRIADEVGPLHRFRRLHLAEIAAGKREMRVHEVPQPAFAVAAARSGAPAGVRHTGVFYQSPQLAIDGADRVWLVYRHFYVPMMGVTLRTHVQGDWGLYARCLEGGAWSRLFRCDEGQGDALQRIAVAPEAGGIALAWTFGRTDRRNPQNWIEDQRAPEKVVPHVAKKGGIAAAGGEAEEGAAKTKKKKTAAVTAAAAGPAPTEGRGIALAAIALDRGSSSAASDAAPVTPLRPATAAIASRPSRPAFQFNGTRYELFHGDLHRHTDISLCMSPSDGTMDDAYRYGIDAAPLDFIGVTDHTHDIAMGDPLSLLWQRIRKEVGRHALAGTFVPFYSYERSRGETDHNVISLRDDILRPHTYPHPEFWRELDADTFTVPHQPFFNAAAWGMRDPVHRPLLEIYQGFRNHSCEADAEHALASGNEIGFIASSDHLSTGASFASVWAEEPTRESLFRALQARRTYAAMDRMMLRVTCGGHWMGEKFTVKELPPIEVAVGPTAPLAEVEVFVDGAARKIPFERDAGGLVRARFMAEAGLTGPHRIHVRVRQTDGNMAWSSPMWIDVGR